MAAELETLCRQAAEELANPEPASEAAPPTPATDKLERKYREMTYSPGVNPFRAGSKNARVYELLQGEGGTKDALAEQSGADPKSVGYALWLLRRSGFPVKKDPETKTYRLEEPPTESATDASANG